MSDPAIEAAQRAWAERYPHGSVILAASAYADGLGTLAIAVAREAHKEIRKLHRPMTNDELRETWPGYAGVSRAVCAGCTDVNRLTWLDECDTAKLIYTSEELS